MKRKRSFIGIIVKLSSVFVLLLLWLSLLAIIVPPHIIPFLGLITLGLPVFFIIHVLFLLWYIYRGDRFLWVLLITSFFTLPSFHSWVSLGSRSAHNGELIELSLLTYNVRMFNAYNWLSESNISEDQGNIIRNAHADVVAIQEYYTFEKTPLIEYPYSYIKHSNPKQTFGLALFSKRPMINYGSVEYEFTEGFNNQFIYGDIVVDSDTVRILNVHLASFYFDVKDFEALKQPNINDVEEFKLRFGSVAKQLFNGFSRRSKQLKTLKSFIKDCPYPVFVCGDMNDAPASYTYRVFNRLLDDSFHAAGRGVGRTYVETFFPLRIDWVFYPQQYEAVQYDVLSRDKKISDHRPVRVGFIRKN